MGIFGATVQKAFFSLKTVCTQEPGNDTVIIPFVSETSSGNFTSSKWC